MKLKHRLLSLVTSFALAFGLSANALAAPANSKTPAPSPDITLTAAQSSVQLGDTVTVDLSVDGSKSGFAALQIEPDYDSSAFTLAKVTTLSNADAKGYLVTAPQWKDNKWTDFLLDNTENLQVNLPSAATYTFKASKVGTYDFSVSASVSAVGYSKSTLKKVGKITITVSAKALTASARKDVTLSGTYGDNLAAKITDQMVTFQDGGKAVSPKGTWALSGSAPTVDAKTATFRFTPEDSDTYAPVEVEIPVSISPKALTASLKLENPSKTYDGSTDAPAGEYSVTLSGALKADKLTASTDGLDAPKYESSNVGEEITITAPFKVSGQNLDCYTFGGKTVAEDTEFSATAEGKITPYTGKVTVQESFASRSYNGSEQPLADTELTLTAENGQALTFGTDYEVSYPDGCSGSADADAKISYTLTGKGNYEGCTFEGGKGSFTILKLPMPTASGTLANASYTLGETYTAPSTDSVTVNASGTLSVRYQVGEEWSTEVPAAPGEYTMGVYFESSDAQYGSGMLSGITAKLRVYKNLTEEDFALDKTEFTYNGEVQKPTVESKNGLAADTDYTVDYLESQDASSYTDAGSYTVAITGKGFYTGEVQLGYTITKAAGSGKVSMANYAFGENAPIPTPESATNGTDAVTYTYTGREGTEYSSATAPTAVGKYTVTAAFAATKNASECTATADFEVTAKGLVADDFSLENASFTYSGEVQTPGVNCKSALTQDTDYTVSYPESKDAGDYTVTITGKGNYSGSVELKYAIAPAVYTLPENAKIETELTEYPASIYSGKSLRLISLKASGLPEGAQFGWKDGEQTLAVNPGKAEYEITVKPNDANYSAVTTKVSVTIASGVTPATGSTAEETQQAIGNQMSTYTAALSKTVSEGGSLNEGVSKDLASLTLSSNLTPKEQDNLKSAYLSDTNLLAALDKTADSVKVSTQLDKNSKTALTGLSIPAGGKAAAAITSGTATYTAKDVTPEKPADGQLIEVELSMNNGSANQQLAAPIQVELKFNAKNADPKGTFRVLHKHTESDNAKSFSTLYDCQSVSKSGDEITVRFLAASLSSFSIQYTAPASSGGSSSGSSATPKPDNDPQPTPTPALTVSESTWLGGYGAMLNAKSGSSLSLDVSACEYLPGYIITGVQKSGVTLNLTTPAGKLSLTPAVAKAMNGSYNYTFADAIAIAGKVAAAAKPAATSAPVKDPTAATPTPEPTKAPTPTPAPTPAATEQPAADTPEPETKSHSALPIVLAILAAAVVLAGGYLVYNNASRKKAIHDVYAPTKKVKVHTAPSTQKPAGAKPSQTKSGKNQKRKR